MALSYLPTTELEAVNIILGTTGESPVNTLVSSGLVNVDIAREALHEVARVFQTEGWYFNREEDYTILLDGSNFLTVPVNTLKLEIVRRLKYRKIALRGTKVYDRDNQTYVFDSALDFDIILFLDYNEMPEAARYYCTIMGAKLYQQRFLGSETLMGFTDEDLRRARAKVEQDEIDNEDFNMMTDDWDTFDTYARIM